MLTNGQPLQKEEEQRGAHDKLHCQGEKEVMVEDGEEEADSEHRPVGHNWTEQWKHSWRRYLRN